MHGPSIWFPFLREVTGSTDRRISTNFQRACRDGVRYKVTAFPRPKKKLPFLKVIISESYRFYMVESCRFPKVTVFQGESYRFWSKLLQKGMKGSTDRRISPNFEKGKAMIHGPPIWSAFLKGDEEIHGPPFRSEFLKGDKGIHGPSI